MSPDNKKRLEKILEQFEVQVALRQQVPDMTRRIFTRDAFRLSHIDTEKHTIN